MSSLVANPLMPKLAVKPNIPNIIERTHYSAPSTHYSSHHSSSKGGGKKGLALTALTLLAFLFFLNILQNCLDDHMAAMNSTANAQHVIIIQAREPEVREMDAQNRKGEIESINSTVSKESRTNPETSKTETSNRYMAQIPIKLRTNEKAVKP